MATDEEIADFFEHFGTKGMRWGVRNNRETPSKKESSSETPSKRFTKKQILIGSAVLVGVAATTVVLMNKGSIKSSVMSKGFEESTLKNGKTQVDKLLAVHGDSKDMGFSKGQLFRRISNLAETEIKQGSYAVNTPIDVANYKSFWKNPNNRYEIKIEALRDIRLPSLKTRFETMAEIMDNPLSGAIKGQTIRDIIVKQQPTLRAKYWARNASADELAKIKYAQITGGDWSKGISKAFTDKLISKGYGAMLDDTDSTNGLAVSPKVLLNRGLFRIVSNNKMSQVEIDDAYKEFRTLMASGNFQINWPVPER